MKFCYYIESYFMPSGVRVSVFQRGNYMYELAHGARHIRWFTDMSLDEVRIALAADGCTIA